MGLVESGVMVISILMMMQKSYAAVYKVGDSAGWTTLGQINYKNWSATKNFQLGDTIIFEYNAKFHNVMQVTHAMYKSCNTSSPIATFTTGNDTIKITKHGHHFFFFCGVPGHCEAGQKVDINVLRVSETTAPTPSSSALASPTVPASFNVSPAPSPSNSIALKETFGFVMMMMMGLVAVSITMLN